MRFLIAFLIVAAIVIGLALLVGCMYTGAGTGIEIHPAVQPAVNVLVGG